MVKITEVSAHSRAKKAGIKEHDLLIAINDNEISENLIDRTVFRILAWKYYKGLIVENQK